MIFAAGLGTRLKPLTDTMPKALVPVGGQPLLWHVMKKLQRAGFNDMVVNVHHFAEQIIDYLHQNQSQDVSVAVSWEKEQLLDTGGGIRKAADLLRGSSSFLIHNVDIFSTLDLNWFVAQEREGALSTLLVSERVTKRYLLFNDDMRLVGWTNVETGEVRTPFESLDIAACRKLAFAGIHLMSQKALDVMNDWPERFPIMDFYLQLAAEYPIYGVEAKKIKLVDVGKLDTLDSLEDTYTEYQ